VLTLLTSSCLCWEIKGEAPRALELILMAFTLCSTAVAAKSIGAKLSRPDRNPSSAACKFWSLEQDLLLSFISLIYKREIIVVLIFQGSCDRWQLSCYILGKVHMPREGSSNADIAAA
jgi:hypothetical protein